MVTSSKCTGTSYGVADAGAAVADMLQGSKGVHCVSSRERTELLRFALARIEPVLRSIFVLREVEGLPYAEIAEAIDVPQGLRDHEYNEQDASWHSS